MSANYIIDMPTTNATMSSSEMSTLSSIYIPRVYANISTEFVAETFESLNLGIVDRVEAVPRPGDKTTYMAFVYFASWNSGNKAAAHLAKRINCPTPGATQARIVYDDPWYWILLPNTSENTSSKKTDDEDEFLAEFNRSNGICAQECLKREDNQEKIGEALKYWAQRKLEENELAQKEMEDAMAEQELNDEETINILTDIVEDLQGRLFESENRIERLEKELCDVRSILLTGKQPTVNFPRELYDTNTMSVNVLEDIVDYPPPPPKLVRQNAVAYPSQIPSIPPPLMRSEPRVYEPDASVELPKEFPEEVPMLPASPFVVEPTHFHSKLPVREILSALADAFEACDVTVTRFKLDARSCGFYCSYYYRQEKVEFVVKVFSTGTENTLIEFQRRSGDRARFFQIYDAVAAEIHSIIDSSVPRSPQSYHQFIPHSTTRHISNEDIAEYRKDRLKRRMEEADIEQVRVDGMGLVYPNNKSSDNFWCDP